MSTIALPARTFLPVAPGDDANVLACNCDAYADGYDGPVAACPICDVTGADTYSMDDAAAAIQLALVAAGHTTTTAYVEQTGGGCATIYVGPDQHPGTNITPVLNIGPGTYGWGRGPSTASTRETYAGACRDRFHDDAATAPLDVTMPDWHADPVAWLTATVLRLYPLALALDANAVTWDEV